MTLSIALYYTASLDGFIADDENNTPWSKTSWEAYLLFCTQVQNLIMGRKTYELFISDPTTRCLTFENLVVVSNDLTRPVNGFVPAASPTDAIGTLLSRGVTQAVLIGGSQVASAFLAAGLISEVRIDIEPIILGSGIKMFLPGVPSTRLKFLSSECDQFGRVTVRYRI